MKKQIALLAVALLLGNAAMAQETADEREMKTLFGKPSFQSLGGYGAIDVGYTQVNKLDAITIGARGAVVVNHGFAIGLGGKGFISEPTFDENLKEDCEFAGGYGGIFFEPIIGWRQPIHLSFPVLVGAGGVGYTKHYGDSGNSNSTTDEKNYSEDSKAFFVLEPGVELEFNMVKFVRLALTASYRYTSDVNLKYKDPGPDVAYMGNPIGHSDMLRGINVGLVMKFGKF